MKKSFLHLPIMMAAIMLLMFSSCKKADDTSDDSISAEDQTNISNALNSTADDATTAAGKISGISGKTDGIIVSLCGATVVNTSYDSLNRQFTITYDGTTNCNGITRSGTVSVQLTNGQHWRDAGAVLTLTLTNLRITRTLTGAYYTLNGTHTVTNESGGLAWQVIDPMGGSNGPVAHRHAGSMQLTFDNGAQRTWTFDRTRTFARSGTVVTVTLSTENTGGIDASGTNRNGNAFTNSITTPIVATNTCFYKPISGLFVHQVANRSAEVLFGVDAGGNPVTSGCAYGFKITAVVNGRTRTRTVSYW